MSRIKSDNINLGDSFYVRAESYEREVELEKKRTDILKLAEIEAQKLINDATKKAHLIIEEAKQSAISEANNIRETSKNEGYQAGYDNGYIDGMKKITGEMEEKVLNVDRFAASTFDIKKRIIKSSQKDIISLVSSISDKICHKQLELNPDIIENIVEASIKLLKEKEEISIIVNPKMADKIWEISEGFKEKIKGLNSIKIIEDSSVSSDGTIVESVNTRIDATIATQIQTITDELMNIVKSTTDEELLEDIEDIENIKNIENEDL